MTDVVAILLLGVHHDRRLRWWKQLARLEPRDQAGENAVILRQNGAGKSTTMQPLRAGRCCITRLPHIFSA